MQIEQLSVTELKLTWTDNSDGEDGFKIDRKIGDGEWTINYVELNNNIEEYTDTEAQPGDDNYYRVYGFKDDKISEKVDLSLNSTFPAPSNLILTQNTISEVELNWDDNSTGEEGFIIDRKIGNGDWQKKYKELSANSTSYTDTNAIPTEINYYRVYAINGEKESDETEANIEVLFPAPSGVSIVQESDIKIKLNWQDNSNGEDGFRIDRSTDNSNWIEYVSVSENIEEWSDEDPVFGVTNYYRVYAYKNEYNSFEYFLVPVRSKHNSFFSSSIK